MAEFEEGDYASENGKDKKYVLHRKAEQKQPEEIHRGNPSDVLLELSEKMLLRELKPKKYHLYCGADDTVHGWDRVAPLSCIILSQKKSKKQRNKEGDNPPTLSTLSDLVAHTAEPSARSVEQRSETHPAFSYLQQGGSWSCSAIAALQLDTKEWPGYDMQKFTSNDMVEEERTQAETSLAPQYHTIKYTQSGRSLSRHQRHKPNSTVVPIKNFSFLPPIESSRLSPKAGGLRPSNGDTPEDRCLIMDKRRGTRMEDLHLQTSNHRTFQHSLSLSYTGLSISKRVQVQVSSKPDTVHQRSNAMAKGLTQVLQNGPAAGPQTQLHPTYLF